MRANVFMAAALGATAALTAQRAAARDVQYIPAPAVSAAFAKGMPLLEQENYKIHASRRSEPGMVEIHEHDTDIIYVLEGTATFVTGGTAHDTKTVAAGEVRGASVEGGVTYTLARGDVMVVPAGTPHWFKHVQGPFLYYVVKVN